MNSSSGTSEGFTALKFAPPTGSILPRPTPCSNSLDHDRNGSFSTDLARRSAGDAENAQQCAVSQLSGRSRQTANDVLGDLAGKSPGAQKVHDSYVAFRDKIAAWSRISTQAMLEARGG
jgi:hypothetical protein